MIDFILTMIGTLFIEFIELTILGSIVYAIVALYIYLDNKYNKYERFIDEY